MAVEADRPPNSDTAILSRLIRPEDTNLSPEAAESLLKIQLEQRDLDRFQALLTKNQEDALTSEEEAELANDRRVSFLPDLMHSKARRSLKIRQDFNAQLL